MASDRVKIIISVTDQFSEGLKSVQSRLGSATAAVMSMRGALIGLGAAAVFTSMIRSMADFEKSMNRVKAVSQATALEFDVLKEQARELGATTVFSAKEVAEGMGFLAQAGFRTNQIIGAMPATLDLAAAAQLDLATSADIVSNVMQGYGLYVSEAGRATDVMAKAFTSSNTDLRQLGQAMKLAGPVASGFGIKFEEAAAALGLMGNAGFQATLSGTGLRGALVRLAVPTKAISNVLGELGIELVNSAGEMDSITEIIRKLEKSGASTAQVMELFGQRAGPSMQALLKQGSVALADFTKKLEAAGGTAKEIADIQLKGLAAEIKLLASAWVEMTLVIGDEGGTSAAGAALRFLTGVVKGVTRDVKELGVLWQNLTVATLLAVAATNLFMNELANKNLADARIELDKMKRVLNDNVKVFDDLNVASADYTETAAKVKKITKETTKEFDAQAEALHIMVRAMSEAQDVVGDFVIPRISLQELLDTEAVLAQAEEVFLEMDRLGEDIVSIQEVLDEQAVLAQANRVFQQMSDDIEGMFDDVDVDGTLGDTFAGIGNQFASQISGASGAIAGFQLAGGREAGLTGATLAGGAAGFFAQLLLENESFREAFKRISEVLIELVAPIAEAIAPMLLAFVPILQELQPVFNFIGQALAVIIGPIARVMGKIATFMARAEVFWQQLSDVGQNLINFIEDLIESIIDLPSEIFEAIKGLFETGGPSSSIGQGIIDTFRSPFHEGGTLSADRMLRVPGLDNDEGLFLGRVGETVVPAGGSTPGTSITIHTTNGVDAAAVNQLEEMAALGRLSFA